MEVFEQPYYRFNKRLLLLIGQWPYQDSTERLYRMHFMNIVYFGFMLPQYRKCHNGNYTADVSFDQHHDQALHVPYLQAQYRMTEDWKMWDSKREMITATMDQSTEVIRYTAFVAAQLFHIFCSSYSGQRMIDHSSEIHLKAYSGLWYEAPIEICKLLILVIRRSYEPSCLTAGKIFVFCLESFTTIVQTSTSYFMVLTSVN
ncbi:hypothetical protein KPH14_003017 [Odynerus spinipes]|uniref:Uncharacterized protein n=1 Tax=Odynerus spinipes TaxID=1348599 RepID=A0AAD9RWM1_9HYME|nr:hypothetical protein KPH14_003017 [Odynerus spinipes]